jgi:hypothetical protein
MGKLNKQYLAEMARKGWITVSVAAKLCRRHRATVYYWINKGYVARCEVNAGKRRTLFVERASLGKLAVLGVERLACSSGDVDRLAQCLGTISPVWCTVDFDLLVQQRAAERLQEQTP